MARSRLRLAVRALLKTRERAKHRIRRRSLPADRRGPTGGLLVGGVTAASACPAVSRRRRDRIRLLGIEGALRDGVLDLPPVVRRQDHSVP